MTTLPDGTALRAIRIKLGLSQVALANLLGVTNVTVNRWEHDHTRPGSDVLDRYLRAERDGLAALTEAAVAGNLPLATSPLIGRLTELDSLLPLVRAHRLVTVLGTGGAGKTRLTLELGARMEREFPAGVWFVDLSLLVDPSEVAYAVARTLGLGESPRRSPAERISEFLAGQSALLLLDNCEHVRSASAELVHAILARDSSSRIVATSRAALDLPGEMRYAIPPLSAQDAAAIMEARVTDRRPDFSPDDSERASIRDLCERLDRLPLAIELAAARMNVLSARQILQRLEQRFSLLETSQARPERQRTLAAAINWSCELLGEREAALFRSLGVFKGSFDLDAVEQISGSSSPFGLLATLADQSMIVVQYQSDSGTPRYRLLESLAAYALEWLEETGDAVAIRLRHACFYRDRIEAFTRDLHTARQGEALAQIEGELENAIAALIWATKSNSALAVELGAALAPYWIRRARFEEGTSFLAPAIRVHATERSPARARALAGLGQLLYPLGQVTEAKAAFDEAEAIALELGEIVLQARAIDARGVMWRNAGELDLSAADHSQAISLWSQTADRRGYASALMNLAHISNVRGDYARAEQGHRDAMAQVVGTGDLTAEAAALANLAEVAARSERLAEARTLNERALEMAQPLGDPDRVAIILANQAEVLLALEQWVEALEYIGRAIDHFQRAEHVAYLAGSRYLEAGILNKLGRTSEAVESFRSAVRAYLSLGAWADLAQTVETLSGMLIAAGDHHRAARWLAGAEAIRAPLGVEPWPLFDHAGAVAATRAALGARFDEVWSGGGELGREHLVAEVLHEGKFARESARPAISSAVSVAHLLTARQLEVLQLASEGLSNRDIAERLHISPRTVERHLTALFNALGTQRRSAAVAIAVDQGLISRRRD